MHSFEVHSNESACRKCGHLGLEQVILGKNKGSISHLLWLDSTIIGYILLADKIVALKRDNFETIIIVKRTEWRKFFDCFGLIIEIYLSNVVKLNVHFVPIGSIPSPSSGNTHIERQQMDK